MKDFEAMIMPGMTHWQHPHFYAYFPANASFPALIADMYSDMINCIGFNWHASPACTELETIVLDWMAKAFALPRPFLSSQGCGGGMIQGTTSESITTVIIAARDRFKETGPVNGAQCVAYGSTQTHVCTKKGAMIANVEFKEIQTNDQCQLTADAVEAAILKDLTEGKKPIYITLTIGTTSSGAVDDIQSITKIAKKYNVWVHVDAAWAGAALVCQEYQYLTQGLEHVDSISMNMHKWLLTNFDCCCLW
jgi:glutamate/tyrosine decarboxylase-like PLP-dependent enzyme